MLRSFEAHAPQGWPATRAGAEWRRGAAFPASTVAWDRWSAYPADCRSLACAARDAPRSTASAIAARCFFVCLVDLCFLRGRAATGWPAVAGGDAGAGAGGGGGCLSLCPCLISSTRSWSCFALKTPTSFSVFACAKASIVPGE